MSDTEQPPLGYIELPADSNPNLPKSRIPGRKYTPTNPQEPQNGGDADAEDTDDDFPPVTPELKKILEKSRIWPKRQNVAEHREPDPEPIPAPTPEPIPEDTDEFKDHEIMVPISVLAYILFKLIRYFKCLAKALYVALPLLLLAFAIWAYVFGEPVDRIGKAFDELVKDRNEARNSWTLF